MPTLQEHISANLRSRGAAERDTFRMEQAALASTRDELRKMQLLRANPELAKDYMAQKAALKAKEDAALADYMVAHPDIAEKIIASELVNAIRKTSKIEHAIGDAELRAIRGPRVGSQHEREQAMLRRQIAAMQSVLESHGINPYLYSSPALNRVKGRVGDLDAIVDAARAAAPVEPAKSMTFEPGRGVSVMRALRSGGPVASTTTKPGGSPYKDAVVGRAAAAAAAAAAPAAAATHAEAAAALFGLRPR